PRQMVERFEYQDAKVNDSANLNGQLVRHYDPSGLAQTVRRDFKGNSLEVKRRLNNQPTESLIDWQHNPFVKLVTETFTQITEYDALNRMTRLYNWHRDANHVAVYQPKYNERGLLKGERLLVRASRKPNGPSGGVNAQEPDAILEIHYN